MNLSSNSIRIRALSPKFDLPLYSKAWKWSKNKPDWFVESMATWNMTKEEFFVKIRDESQVDFGVFNPTLTAVITSNEVAPGIIEAHIECAENTSLETATIGCRMVMDHCFEKGLKLVIVWVQSFNRPILKMYESLGFQPTGLRLLRGSCKGRVVEWRQFVASPLKENKLAENAHFSYNQTNK